MIGFRNIAIIAKIAVPATIVAVVRDSHVEVPTRETTLKAGDEVIVLATSDAEAAIKELLIA